MAGSEVPDLHLLLVGDVYGGGNWYSVVLQDIRASGLTGRTVILPFQDDMRGVLSASDVVVLCSEDEPLSMCIMEALAMERPVVVSNAGGFPEFISDGRTGYVAQSQDPSCIASLITSAVRDADKAASMASAGRRAMAEEHSVTKMADKVMHVWDRVIRGH
jgi:glycosyltransferase involved in cell wall biosynthesis